MSITWSGKSISTLLLKGGSGYIDAIVAIGDWNRKSSKEKKAYVFII